MKRLIKYCCMMLTLTALCVVPVMDNVRAAGDVVVIVNKGREAPSRVQVSRMFTARLKSWPDGSPLKTLINSDPAIYAAFCAEYMRVSPETLDVMLREEQVRSGEPMPRRVNSRVTRIMVEGSPVFIGFVKRSETGDNVTLVE